eukprot:Plantae.Rhodophyta-Rhodochaete_pulchella.ctg3829.p1 GENE.Plantae.Rhodophyta-Rhodochaete_pulchella.ctg3829~~Plantae.Rhodophyta-Rhodochaete_pulchella.ctg3829.p1  ORF type:complete len:416 (+),score=63.67 Plantae.Rhodophyta-Rhodochaete_pulchella.ctg3829:182-1429(+)
MAFVSSGSIAVASQTSSTWISGAPKRAPAAARRRTISVVTMNGVPPPAPNPTVPETSIAALINPDNEKRVNIGIIGAGRIGQVHADNIAFRLKSANLVGVASGSKALADRCSLEHGCRPYYDYHELLENPDLDAVCICSASNQHTAQIIAAAEAGKHIFVEKPIDTDLAVIDKALKAVHKAGVKCQVGFNRRFDTNYARVKKAIEVGEIGAPHMIRITSRDPSPPPEEYIKSSGGIWIDCTIHDFDMCRWLVGDEVEEVYALGAVNIVPEMAKYGDVDTSLVTLKFKNGVIGSIDNSRQAVYGYDQRCEVFGSAGQIAINNNYANSAVTSTNKHIQRDLPLHFFMDRYTDSFITELGDFCDCLLNGTPIPCTGWDGRAPVVIAMAAKKSYQEGRPVKLSEVDVPIPKELHGWNGQ